MKNIYDQLYKQLNHLANTIPNCNFLDYNTKQDLIQDALIALHNKIKEGVLSEDFNEIRGYSFLTLRNFCNKNHREQIKRETPVSDFWELTDENTTEQDEQYAQYLHKIVRNYLLQTKYSPMDRRVGELLLDSLEDPQIEMETGLTKLEIRKHKFRIKNKLKFDWKRKVKFWIRNIHNPSLKIPCFSIADAKNYLSHIEQKQVSYMLKEEGFISPCGHYFEVIVKRKIKQKKI